jgi:hypothetical protein
MNAIVSRNLIRLVAAPAGAPTAFTFTGNATLDAAQQQYPFFGGYEGALLVHHRGNR